VVLSIDEKSKNQALDRTQPGLPLKKERGPAMTHDYNRNGTTDLPQKNRPICKDSLFEQCSTEQGEQPLGVVRFHARALPGMNLPFLRPGH
jgi:hypothetical protein